MLKLTVHRERQEGGERISELIGGRLTGKCQPDWRVGDKVCNLVALNDKSETVTVPKACVVAIKDNWAELMTDGPFPLGGE